MLWCEYTSVKVDLSTVFSIKNNYVRDKKLGIDSEKTGTYNTNQKFK